jgi:tetratricopeptide (TPR) repeat protein
MTPDRFQQIEQLYHAVRERTAEERAALLAQADPELRREVESLFAQRTGGEFLDRPAIENAPQLLEDSTLTGLPVPANLGPYRIESKLGQGGMGEVFRAVDTRLGRAVAIKITRDELSARFEREARAIASLNHPNICTLYDVGPNYLVMELVEGETIAARLKRGPLSMTTALLYGSQIAAGLAEAHAKGIIHRDVKPGNIMIARCGVKVLDFGLARSGHDETVTASRMLIGTPGYMSPEQRERKPADARSDIYSFGCVLYEMLTGARVGSTGRRVPARKLEGIVSRCLEEDPGRRWQSAAELERALSGIDATGSRGKRMLAVAAAALGLSAGAYFYFHRAPTLTDKDTIVLADFDNKTGDTVFDGTLRQGLSVQLEQSPFLSIVSDQQIQQTLQMMGQRADARLTPEIARELCQRTAGGAVLDGSIAQIGTPYLLTVKAVNCSNGETLASTEAQASDKNHVLDALGKTASEMRNKLGESLSTVQKFDTPLVQATTPSLEALKAFSSGSRATSPPLAITFYKRAVELDPDFAVAYAWLGIWYTSIGEPSIAAGYTRKAYELRGHASEPERHFVSAIYYKEVPGNLEKAEQSCKLWMQTYPRAEMPHIYLAGAIYPAMGRYDGVLSEAREAIRLKPDYPVSYAFLTEGYMTLNRFDEANATYKQALERKLYHHYYPLILYEIAFLHGDPAGMRQQVTLSAGQPGVEDTLLVYEADTAAYSGRLREAGELTRRAMESAERAEANERSAGFSATSGLREALFGNAGEARRRASLAVARSSGVDVLYAAALALAYAGDTRRARDLTEELSKRFPEATTVQFNYLPTVRAKLALNRGNASEALEILTAAAPYELGLTTFSGYYAWNGLYPVFVRGEAYLAAHQGSNAAVEFEKVLDHRGIVWNSPIGALAHLQLGRAYSMQGDTPKARAAYNDFLTLWKDADPDIAVLKQAKAEYASLQ